MLHIIYIIKIKPSTFYYISNLRSSFQDISDFMNMFQVTTYVCIQGILFYDFLFMLYTYIVYNNSVLLRIIF